MNISPRWSFNISLIALKINLESFKTSAIHTKLTPIQSGQRLANIPENDPLDIVSYKCGKASARCIRRDLFASPIVSSPLNNIHKTTEATLLYLGRELTQSFADSTKNEDVVKKVSINQKGLLSLMR